MKHHLFRAIGGVLIAPCLFATSHVVALIAVAAFAAIAFTMYASQPRLVTARGFRDAGDPLVRMDLRASVSVLLVACLITVPLAGCTAQQKQTTLQVVQQINAKLPEITAAADTLAATIAALDPAEAVLIGVGDVAFDAAAKGLQTLVSSYLANPNASTLQAIQSAINTLQANIDSATFGALGIKNTVHQQLALAALKGLLTVVTIVFGIVAPTETVAMLDDLRATHAIQLARLRPYMDEGALERAAREQGAPALMPASWAVDAAFDQAAAAGF